MPEKQLSIIQTFAEVRTYFTPDDRRQWIFLLAISLTTGGSQALILALFNDAAAKHIGGGPNLLHMVSLVGLVAAGIVCGYIGTVRGHMVSARTAIRFRNRLLDEIQAANLRLVERVGPSVIHYHLMATIGQLAGSYGSLMSFISSAVMLTCIFIYLGSLSPISLACAIVIATVGVMVHLRQERINLQRRILADRLSNENSARHREAIDGYKELRMSSAKSADYRAHIDKSNVELANANLKVTRISLTADLTNNFFQFLLIFIMIFVLPLFIRLDGVVMLQMMGAVFITMGPLAGVVGAIPNFAQVRVALDNIKKLQLEMAATREVPTHVKSTYRLPAFESLQLQGLGFEFENEANGDGFRIGPIDLAIRRGEILFIVGGNGSGKTVLLRLLTALYHHTSGNILYNGHPVEAADRQQYREQFSGVFSHFHLFREFLGLPAVNETLVQHWLKRLDLIDKVAISNGGFTSVALSAGQRKRLAYLHCMLENRPIIVLDEFGAEQDPGHRHKFYRELLAELKAQKKTVIVVTHDDLYFDAADRVIKMDFGRIVEDYTIPHMSQPPVSPDTDTALRQEAT